MGKISSLALSLTLALVVALAGASPAAAIPVNNWSFEDPIVFNYGSWSQGVDIPGWNSSNTGWTGAIRGYGTAADGNNAAWAQDGNWIYQDLAATLRANMHYTLSVSVGHRDSQACNAEIQLLAGGTPLLDEIVSSSEVTEGSYKIFTWKYDSPASVTPGQQLEIKLISAPGANQPHFDAVILNAFPLYITSVYQMLLED